MYYQTTTSISTPTADNSNVRPVLSLSKYLRILAVLVVFMAAFSQQAVARLYPVDIQGTWQMIVLDDQGNITCQYCLKLGAERFAAQGGKVNLGGTTADSFMLGTWRLDDKMLYLSFPKDGLNFEYKVKKADRTQLKLEQYGHVMIWNRVPDNTIDSYMP